MFLHTHTYGNTIFALRVYIHMYISKNWCYSPLFTITYGGGHSLIHPRAVSSDRGWMVHPCWWFISEGTRNSRPRKESDTTKMVKEHVQRPLSIMFFLTNEDVCILAHFPGFCNSPLKQNLLKPYLISYNSNTGICKSYIILIHINLECWFG